MSLHPDAAAFMRSILDNPTELTTRLVFADWLEETGEPSNVAWAGYIRLMAKTNTHPPASAEYEEQQRKAMTFARDIHTKLPIAAGWQSKQLPLLLQLLPSANVILALSGYEIPRGIFELIPESVARDNVLIPLLLEDNFLWLAMADPANSNSINTLKLILDIDIMPVQASAEEILNAINTHYGTTEISTVDAARDQEAADFTRRVLANVLGMGASRFRLIAYPGRSEVSYFVSGNWVQREPFTRDQCELFSYRIAELARLNSDLGRIERAGNALRAVGEFRLDYHGAIHTIRATIDWTRPSATNSQSRTVLDLDISEHFELA
jgi:uncharacterized protein (TIGR02996 family)